MEEKKPGLQLSKIDMAGIALLLLCIIGVRLFEGKLFYDPLLAFFKDDDAKPLPPYNSLALFLGLAFRYVLNSVFSLGIIYLVFKDRSMLKLTTVLYAVFFAVLIAAFFLVLSADKPNVLLLFYIRRFLIQPLFLILFVPAFYYQKIMS
jgi:exosortase F-associated protein